MIKTHSQLQLYIRVPVHSVFVNKHKKGIIFVKVNKFDPIT